MGWGFDDMCEFLIEEWIWGVIEVRYLGRFRVPFLGRLDISLFMAMRVLFRRVIECLVDSKRLGRLFKIQSWSADEVTILQFGKTFDMNEPLQYLVLEKMGRRYSGLNAVSVDIYDMQGAGYMPESLRFELEVCMHDVCFSFPYGVH